MPCVSAMPGEASHDDEAGVAAAGILSRLHGSDSFAAIDVVYGNDRPTPPLTDAKCKRIEARGLKALSRDTSRCVGGQCDEPCANAEYFA